MMRWPPPTTLVKRSMRAHLMQKTKVPLAHSPVSGLTVRCIVITSSGDGHVTVPTLPASSSAISANAVKRARCL